MYEGIAVIKNKYEIEIENSLEANLRPFEKELLNFRISNIPTTRYYGSKRRILNWIYNSIRDLDFDRVLDGFGGSASVSLLFKLMGKEVTFHDALFFNTISAYALLSNYNPLDNDEEIIYFFDSVEPKKGFIYKTFEGLYYTDEENAWLDGVIFKIFSIDSFEKKCLFFYCLFQACLKKRPFNLFHRANLYIRQNKAVKKSFGNQTTWDTPFSILVKQAYKELSKAIWNSEREHCILSPTDVFKIEPVYDLVYLDPPYININGHSDDYLKRYHFLEGIIKYDMWNLMIDYNYKTLSHYPIPYIREWHCKMNFKSRLFELIRRHSKSIVVLSYMEKSYPTKNDLISFFKDNFSEVRISELDLPHALAKERKKELLIIGVPK